MVWKVEGSFTEYLIFQSELPYQLCAIILCVMLKWESSDVAVLWKWHLNDLRSHFYSRMDSHSEHAGADCMLQWNSKTKRHTVRDLNISVKCFLIDLWIVEKTKKNKKGIEFIVSRVITVPWYIVWNNKSFKHRTYSKTHDNKTQ